MKNKKRIFIFLTSVMLFSLALFLVFSRHTSPTSPTSLTSPKPEIVMAKTTFKAGEKITAVIALHTKNTAKHVSVLGVSKAYADDVPKVTLENLTLQKQVSDIPVNVTQANSTDVSYDVSVDPAGHNLRPGVYRMKTIVVVDGKTQGLQQNFYYGVLAINTDKSIYQQNEKVYLQMAALNSDGHTLCNSNLELTIVSPNQTVSKYTVKNKSIAKSKTCGPDNVTDNPDYSATYTTKGAGTYKILFTNTDTGYAITDSFTVKNSVPFVVKRTSATRVNPFLSSYTMHISITANQDYSGEITESVPKGFVIQSSSVIPSHASVIPVKTGIQDSGSPIKSGMTIENQTIVWTENLTKGQTVQLSYTYQSPKISPQFYLLGTLKIGNVFEEARQWQLASDFACSSTGGNWGTGGTWTSCNSTTPQPGDTVAITSGTVTGNATASVASISISGGATLTFAAQTVTITLTATSGTLLAATGTYTKGTETITTTSASAPTQIFSGTVSLNNLTINQAAVIFPLGTAITVGSTLTITAGTLDDGGNQITGPGAGAGTFTISAGAQFNLGSAAAATTMPVFQTYTFSSTSTVQYQAAGPQTISITPTYGNLSSKALASYAGSPGDIGTFSTTSQAQLPTNLDWNSAITATIANTTYVYLLGGSINNGFNQISTVYKAQINTSANLGAFATTSQAQLPKGIQAGTSVIYANTAGTNYVYLMGGQTATTTVYKSQINTSANLGTFDTTSQGQLTQVIQNGTSVIYANTAGTNYVYLMGGISLSTAFKSQINTSANLGTFDTTSQAQLPQVINGPTSVVAVIANTTYVYVIGGLNGATNLSTAYKSQIDTSANLGTFDTTSQAQLPQVIRSTASVTATIGGTTYVYLIGGLTTGSVIISTVYKSQIDTSANLGTFDTASQAQLPQVIATHTAVAATIGGTTYVYVMGGTSLSTVYKAQISTSTASVHTVAAGTLSVAGNLVIGDGSHAETFDTSTNAVTANITGNVTVAASGTFSANASTTTSVTGSWTNSGTYTHNNGTVTFTSTAAGKTITSGGSAFYNLTFNGSGGKWTQQDAVTISNNLLISAGTYDDGGNQITGNVTGALTVTGQLNLGSASTATTWPATFTNAHTTISSGSTVQYQAGAAQTIATKDSAGTAFTSHYYNLNDEALATATHTVQAGTLSVDNNLIVGDATNANTMTAATNSSTVTVTGTTTIAAGSFFTTHATNVTTFTGNLTINSTGTLTCTSSCPITATGNWTNSGTFTANTGTVTFNATATGKTITSNGASGPFYDLTFNGVSGGWTLQDNTTVSHVLTITNGNFSAGSVTLTLSGTGTVYSNSGTFTPATSTIAYTNGTSANVAAITYYNLQTNGAGTYTLAGAVTVSNNLTITAGTLDDSSGNNYAISIGGNWSNSGTFTARNGTVTFTNTGTSTFTGNTTFYNLTNIIAGSTMTFTAASTQTISGVLVIRGTGASNITLKSSVNTSAWNITPSSSANVNVSYVNVRDSNETSASTKIYAGYSTDSTGNTNWVFNNVSAANRPASGLFIQGNVRFK